MNIVVLAGGLSTERNVSLTTGAMVQNALVKRGHHAILADVFLGYPLSGSIEEEFKKRNWIPVLFLHIYLYFSLAYSVFVLHRKARIPTDS